MTRNTQSNKAPRRIGVLFNDVSIERVACATLRAASCWGGRATLAIDRANVATAYCTGTRDDMDLWQTAYADIVGVFAGEWGARAKGRKHAEAIIGDAIVAHLECRMREAA